MGRCGLVVSLVLLVVPGVAVAAPVCGSVTTNITATDRSSATIAYTTPVGSQLLVVGVSTRDATGDVVSSITHAGNAVALKIAHDHTAGDTKSVLGFIKEPTAGTNNVVVTWTGSVLASGVFIMSCSGVHSDADPFRGTGNSSQGVGTAIGVTAADVDGDLIIDVMSHDGQTTAPTVGLNQTVIFAASPGSEFSMGASYELGGLGGFMNWTGALSNDWVIVAAPLREADTGSTMMMRRRWQ